MAGKPTTRRRVLALVLVLIAVSFGCQPLALPFYLFNINKPKLPSYYSFYEKAKTAKKKKDIKVAVLVDRARTLSPDFIGSERTLNTRFVNTLKAQFEVNKERVTITPVAEVEKFKREHEDWRIMEGYEIAKLLGVDYIIDLELSSLSLYEPGAHNMLLRAHCSVSVRVRDSERDAAELFPPYELSKEYPKGGTPLAVDPSSSAQQFLDKFLQKVATELTGLFTPLQTRDHFE